MSSCEASATAAWALGFWLALVIAIAWAFWALNGSLGLPVVTFSYGTGECLGVLKTQPEHKGFSCTNLPPKYQKEWAE